MHKRRPIAGNELKGFRCKQCPDVLAAVVSLRYGINTCPQRRRFLAQAHYEYFLLCSFFTSKDVSDFKFFSFTFKDLSNFEFLPAHSQGEVHYW